MLLSTILLYLLKEKEQKNIAFHIYIYFFYLV